MELNDFAEPEIAVTAAVAAAIFSPRARKVMRQGLVYGMAGVLAAGDVVTSFARSVGQGVQQVSASAQQDEQAASPALESAPTEPSPTPETPSRRRTAKSRETEKVEGEQA